MTATIIDLRHYQQARRVQDLSRAARHLEVAEALAKGALDTLLLLADRAVQHRGLDFPGALGLQLAASYVRDTAAELADANRAFVAAAGEADSHPLDGGGVA